MISFTEFRIPWTPKDFCKLRRLYLDVLWTHKCWHFFWEGTVMFLRDEEVFSSAISEWLDKKKIKYTTGPYEENIPITKKYLRGFLAIFHEFSVLAMEMKKDELHALSDRVFHCFLNVMRKPEEIKKLAGFGSSGYNAEYTWEPMMLAYHAITRGMTIGFLIALENNKDKK